ncbi:MAG: T9SS type A sorting domain-containing protein [Chitinophagales bacterium]
MKKVFTFTLALCSLVMAVGQTPLPNGGFENWSGTVSAPTSWSSIDQLLGQFGSNPGLVTRETNAAHVAAGSSSMKLKTDSVTISLLGQTLLIPGLAVCQKLGFDLATTSPSIDGYAYTSRPDSISFQYQYQSGAGAADTGGVYVRLTKWDNLLQQAIEIGTAFVRVTNSASFQTAKGKIVYTSAMNPDTLLIVAAASAPADLNGLGGFGGALTGGLGVKGTTFWVDDMQFLGLDTAFKVYLNPNSDQQICAGDTTGIITDNIPGNTYQWYNGATAITGATQYFNVITTAGNYYVRVGHQGAVYYSDTVVVSVSTPPAVSFTGLQDSICRNAQALVLSGGSPAGGQYSGSGVINNAFNPVVAGNGTKTVTYTYTDTTTGCSGSASRSIVVHACSNGIEALQQGVTLSVYPNPASTQLVIEGNELVRNATAVVYNANGEMVITQVLNSNTAVLPVQQLPLGTYVLYLRDAKGNALGKGTFNVMH